MEPKSPMLLPGALVGLSHLVTPGEQSFYPPGKDDPHRMRRALDVFAVMCRYNSHYLHADDARYVTPFHSVAEPPVALSEYVDRLDKQTHCGEEAVLISFVLVGRFCSTVRMLPSVLCMHRMVLIAIRIAVKAHHDVFRSNKAYANAGGLQLQELNELESFMLTVLDYNVLVTNSEITKLRAAIALAGTAKDTVTLATQLASAIDPNGAAAAFGAVASGSGSSAIHALRSARSESPLDKLRLYDVDFSDVTALQLRHHTTSGLSSSGVDVLSQYSAAGAPANSDASQRSARSTYLASSTSSSNTLGGSGRRDDGAPVQRTQQHQHQRHQQQQQLPRPPALPSAPSGPAPSSNGRPRRVQSTSTYATV